jgi:hypothetical protein
VVGDSESWTGNKFSRVVVGAVLLSEGGDGQARTGRCVVCKSFSYKLVDF